MEEKCDKVVLEMDVHAYRKIALTMRDHKNMLSCLKMNDLIKNDLMRDMDIIRRILEASEVKNGRS